MLRSFTLSGKRCYPVNRGRTQEVKRVGAEIEAPVGGTAHSAGTRARSRPAFHRMSCAPTSIHFFGPFSDWPQVLGRVLHPHVNRIFSISTELGPFKEVFTPYVR